MKIKGNRFEFTFDASSARIANYSIKSLVIVDSVDEGGSTKHRTFIKRLDKLNGFTFENDLGEVINLTNNVTENVNQLLRAGMKFNNADTKDITQKGADLNKEADTYEPQYINVIVNFKSDTSGDDYECIELAFERPRSVNEATVTLSEVLEMLSYDTNFNELAAEKLANGGRIVGATTEDGKSIIPSAKIFNDTEIWCQWNETSKSYWTREEAGIDDNSDEFTYVKTPGKISKLFVHVGANCLPDIHRYPDWDDRCRLYNNDNDVLSSNYDYSDFFDGLGFNSWEQNGTRDVLKHFSSLPALQLRSYILANVVGIVSFEDDDHVDEGRELNVRYHIDHRLQEGINKLTPIIVNKDTVSYIKDSCGTPLSEAMYNNNSNANEEARCIIEENDLDRYLNQIKVVNNVAFTIVLPANITENNTIPDLFNLIFNDENKDTIYNAFVDNNTMYEDSGFIDIRDANKDTFFEYFKISDYLYNAYVVSPELLYRGDNGYRFYNTHHISKDGIYADRSFATLYETQIHPDYETNGAHFNTDIGEAGISCNWCGVHIVKKAIEEGRALDVFLEPKNAYLLCGNLKNDV